MFNSEHDTYPHDLAGEPAPPPEPAPAPVVGMGRRIAARERNAAEPVFELAQWRPAESIVRLLTEANLANPRRDKSSDGIVGDSRHAARISDHNPDRNGVVRALDLDTDGLNLPAAFERARQLAHAGKLPQLAYLILNGRITAPDFSGWRVYIGDPHVTHGHVSVVADPRRYDLKTPWGIFAPAAKPVPAKPSPIPTSGHDLTGRGPALRGDQGDTGPRVGQLQAFLRRYAPAYAGGLAVDSVWGPKTSAALAQFGHRSNILEADGRNIGPKLAAALWRAGFDRSAAQARALAHLARAGRR
jgi:hypothetical protein